MKQKHRDARRQQLGMNEGTAYRKLTKAVLFRTVQRAGFDICFRCGEKIENEEDFSLDHIKDWLHSDNPQGLYFDPDNVAFSHKKCNVPHANSTPEHGTLSRYNHHGCRCSDCTGTMRSYMRGYRKRS